MQDWQIIETIATKVAMCYEIDWRDLLSRKFHSHSGRCAFFHILTLYKGDEFECEMFGRSKATVRRAEEHRAHALKYDSRYRKALGIIYHEMQRNDYTSISA